MSKVNGGPSSPLVLDDAEAHWIPLDWEIGVGVNKGKVWDRDQAVVRRMAHGEGAGR